MGRSTEKIGVRAVILALAIALLAGCSTVTVEQEAEQAKVSWQGATYDEVVMRWGPPNRSATLSDGRQTHTWTSQEGPIRAGFAQRSRIGRGCSAGTVASGREFCGPRKPPFLGGRPAPELQLRRPEAEVPLRQGGLR